MTCQCGHKANEHYSGTLSCLKLSCECRSFAPAPAGPAGDALLATSGKVQVLDAGHSYLLGSLDGDTKQVLTFVKRAGEHYPGNVGHYAGTTTQDVLRVLLNRLRYVNRQIPAYETESAITLLGQALRVLEMRAARLHGRELPNGVNPETDSTCEYCNHVACPKDCSAYRLQSAPAPCTHRNAHAPGATEVWCSTCQTKVPVAAPAQPPDFEKELLMCAFVLRKVAGAIERGVADRDDIISLRVTAEQAEAALRAQKEGG